MLYIRMFCVKVTALKVAFVLFRQAVKNNDSSAFVKQIYLSFIEKYN